MNSSLAPILQYFFTEHLSSHKQVSPRTIIAYRDSFRLLLQFLKKSTGKQPSNLCVQDLDAPAILDFLESLETERDNQVCSRNARLTAIRSFFHVVALRDPACVGIVTRVLAIPRKRTDKRLVGYLTREEIDAVLAAPDQATWIGRRDHALLLTMYNSRARLSEMTCMKRAQIRFDSTTYLQLHGKGRKERMVPLWAKTGRVLQHWLRELEIKKTEVVFPSIRGTPLSCDGLDYILQQSGMPESSRQAGYPTCRETHLRHAFAASRKRHGRDRPMARPREHRNNSHLCRSRSCDERTGAGTNCTRRFPGSPIQGGRCAAGLSRLSLIFRVLLDESQALGQVATNTRNIPGLGISTENLR